MKTLIRLVNGQEVSRKDAYSNEIKATNAGNSWVRDCRIHAEVRKERSFKII